MSWYFFTFSEGIQFSCGWETRLWGIKGGIDVVQQEVTTTSVNFSLEMPTAIQFGYFARAKFCLNVLSIEKLLLWPVSELSFRAWTIVNARYDYHVNMKRSGIDVANVSDVPSISTFSNSNPGFRRWCKSEIA